MLSLSRSLFFLLATFILPHLTTALPPFNDNAVAYLTNCATSDTGVAYSETSLYLDVAASFTDQSPDAYEDTSLGAVTTWEGASVTWSYAGADPNTPNTFAEFIVANAQDPSIPTFTQVGCATYSDFFVGGAVVSQWACFKDSPRVLYTTSDHECTTVYYCRITHDTPCPFDGPSGNARLVDQAKEL